MRFSIDGVGVRVIEAVASKRLYIVKPFIRHSSKCQRSLQSGDETLPALSILNLIHWTDNSVP